MIQMLLIRLIIGHCISSYFNASNGIRQGSILSPRLFSVYVDDLYNALYHAKVGCFIDNVCMNHLIYVDDICLSAHTPSNLRNILNVCDDFERANSISFNPSKSVYIVFAPKNFNLFVPDMIFNSMLLKHSFDVKYLGFRFNNKLCDDDDILKELRNLYIRSNVLVRTFNKCSDQVKIALFKSYCTAMYCSHLWINYKKSLFSKVRVAYNNVLSDFLHYHLTSFKCKLYVCFK